MQTEIDFTRIVHDHERPETNGHLKSNYDRFTAQAKQVYDLMMSGKRLTMVMCLNEYHIGSVSARISELKKKGVPIQKEWEMDDDNKRTKNRVYFISPEHFEKQKQLL